MTGSRSVGYGLFAVGVGGFLWAVVALVRDPRQGWPFLLFPALFVCWAGWQRLTVWWTSRAAAGRLRAGSDDWQDLMLVWRNKTLVRGLRNPMVWDPLTILVTDAARPARRGEVRLARNLLVLLRWIETNKSLTLLGSCLCAGIRDSELVAHMNRDVVLDESSVQMLAGLLRGRP